MTTKLVTLKTTQTLIADVESKEDVLIIKNPVQVIVQPGKDGPMMGFAPFLEFSEDFKTGIKMPFDSVLTITTPVRELENKYSEMFGAGIQIASVIPNV